MAMKQTQRGFTLLIALIFVSVMLAFGLALGSLSFKQQELASSATESQYAFYAADAALECALYADQQQGSFAYPPIDPRAAPGITCDGGTPVSSSEISYLPTWVFTERLSLDLDKHCADVTVYKPNPSVVGAVTYIFSQGYDVSCATLTSPNGVQIAARGIDIHY